MSAQDKTEQVLRDIHILFSNTKAYEKDTGKVIVDKKEMLELLNRLNVCMYEMMDEYEINQQGRDRIEREARKVGEEIIKDASRKAEDVYAASVIYTDEALHHVQSIMQTATDSVKEIYDKMQEQLKKEKDIVHRDQSELKGHLQNLVDTEKYLKIIEDKNKEIKKEKEKERKEQEASSYAAIKPEIRINPEYFEKTGIAYEDEVPEQPMEQSAPQAAQVNVNLDAEYFHWKEDSKQRPDSRKVDKHTLFSKFYKNGNS